MKERSLGQTRFGRTTRTAFRDGLVSTNGRVAVVGLVAALATLAFAVWLKVESRRQAQVRIPLAASAGQLDAAIPTALALLQAWILSGDPTYRKSIRSIWGDEIAPGLEGLRKAAEDSRDPKLVEAVDRLGLDLRRLEVDQTWLEETARAEGNVPARTLLNQEAARIVESITTGTGALLRARTEGIGQEYLLELSAYQGEVQALLSAALAFLEAATPVERQQLEQKLEALERRQRSLVEGRPEGRSEVLDVLDLALGESTPFVAAVRKAVQLRSQPDWNLSIAYRSQVRPKYLRIRALSSSIAMGQAEAIVGAANTASRGTTVVVGLALLVGFLSASGLYYSIRLEHRMQQIASKAQMLGQYAIEAPLGRGGMGDVYRARHALLRRPTAIKLLRRGAELDPLAQDRFRKEVQLTSQLTHPNTIQVFDYGRTPDGVLYYAMELLDGVDLDVLVRRTGPMSPERAVSVLTQICGSLAEAHALGLLHRDLKPSNVMLTRRGGQWDVAKVLDFGLAAQMGAGTGGRGLVGTPSYMAPEIIESPDAASVRSDLYAVGCMGYFLLTGTSVFTGDHVEAILAGHRSEPPVRPSERAGRSFPEGLEAVLLGCLEKDPELRPSSAAHLERLLAASVETLWTSTDAEAWWRDYGEALQAERRAEAEAEADA